MRHSEIVNKGCLTGMFCSPHNGLYFFIVHSTITVVLLISSSFKVCPSVMITLLYILYIFTVTLTVATFCYGEAHDMSPEWPYFVTMG